VGIRMKKNPGRKERRKSMQQSVDKDDKPRSKHYRGKLHTSEHTDIGSRRKMMGLSKKKE